MGSRNDGLYVLWRWSGCKQTCTRDARLDPQCAITGGIAKRKHREHELDILPGQRTQIEIRYEIFAVVLFAECPEVTHDSIGELIIHAQQHATGCRATFTVNDPLEAVAVLHSEGWIDRADITIVDILWDRQQAGVQRG